MSIKKNHRLRGIISITASITLITLIVGIIVASYIQPTDVITFLFVF